MRLGEWAAQTLGALPFEKEEEPLMLVHLINRTLALHTDAVLEGEDKVSGRVLAAVRAEVSAAANVAPLELAEEVSDESPGPRIPSPRRAMMDLLKKYTRPKDEV